METKFCTRCKKDLPRSEFHKLHKSKDGLQYGCKKCLAIACAATRDPVRSKLAKKRWHKVNAEKGRMRARARRAQTAEWTRANRKRVNATARKRRRHTEAGRESVEHGILFTRLRRKKLTLDQYHSLAEKQDFLCAICGTVPIPKKRGSCDGFEIDHHHVTSKVRGLLCGGCNRGIAQLRDSPTRCESAASYLRLQGSVNP